MQEINFTKMVASGNDFIVVYPSPRLSAARLEKIARKLCNRKYGVGADGLLVLEKSNLANARMRIFNADGSEAEMCGNGARCTALHLGQRDVRIETRAGIIESKAKGNNIKIKLSNPKGVKLNIPIKINNRPLKVNFIDTGVPHVVIFVEGLDDIDVVGIGRPIRYHKRFAPRGANVNFVEVQSKDSIKIRTYERGVEDETLSCGTGSVASSLIFALRIKADNKIRIHTKARESLSVYFQLQDNKFRNVWLEGKARIVYKGAYYVK